MKRQTWIKHHKWLGIAFCFFMLMFCVSGIILNHRRIVSDINVGRKWLPERYLYSHWNGGLLRASLPYSDRVLVYGTGGIWQSDSTAAFFSDFNKGLPAGADYRQIRSIIETKNHVLFAVSIFGLYRYADDGAGWLPVKIPKEDDGLLTDIACHGDTLIVADRSFLYQSEAPYTSFKKIELPAPDNYREEVSLFRTIWTLHSGELFGLPGRIIVDFIGIILILLCCTGLMFWVLPKYLRRKRGKGEYPLIATWLTHMSFIWHDRIGRTTIVLTLFISITGWCLRPPMMIPLAQTKVPALSLQGSPNPWHDKLRMIRYDDEANDWLISTSDGFYSFKTPEETPVRIGHTPPVSVMGLNVFRKDDSGRWLCGSFSGMFIWDRQHNTVADYFTGEPADDNPGPPFGNKAISGYSDDFEAGPFTIEYYNGTDAVVQPEELSALPMSLWSLALEIHSGRIYMGIAATYIFIFFAGIAAVWCLWSGWKSKRFS
jgi:hypothetical protein